MSGATFILFINLAIAGLFTGAFVLIAAYDRSNIAARWFGVTYAFGVANLSFEATLPLLDDARVAAFMAYTAFLSALLCLNIGLAARYRVGLPLNLLAGSFAVGLVIAALVQEMPRDSMLRLFLYQLPYVLMQATGAAIVIKARGRSIADNLLAGFLLLSALHYVAKPFLAVALGGPGASAQQYLSSDYAMVSQATGTVLVVTTALLLLGMLVVDILRRFILTSETDALSGLLNRRGFEVRLEEQVARSGSGPLSLVISDLDHFKRVNDTWGHASGDRLIGEFARALCDQAGERYVLGRIGGEEFAVILPDTDLPAGRLFAEGARSAYAARSACALPEAAATFTASFGVAQLMAGETAASLFARADAALYEAKRAGRDCVRVSRPAPVGFTARGMAS